MSQGERITHGRHCTCSPCAREDWTNPKLSPCGMHGSSCPAEYAPLGSAGSYYFPPTPDGKRVYVWSYMVDGDVTLTEKDARDHMDSDDEELTEEHWLMAARYQMPEGLENCDLERWR